MWSDSPYCSASSSADNYLSVVTETPIIGAESANENLAAGQMNWPHGFNLRYMTIEPGSASKMHVRHEEEVIFVHCGELTVSLPGGSLDMIAGDTLTIPIGMERVFSNDGTNRVEAYVVRGGDSPRAATTVD